MIYKEVEKHAWVAIARANSAKEKKWKHFPSETSARKASFFVVSARKSS
jgi:hypothetical protein